MADKDKRIGCKPGFMKLVVEDAEAAVEFYQSALGLSRSDTVDLPTILEIMMVSPDSDYEIVLVEYRRPFELAIGNNWGPIGFETDDIDTLLARVLAAGAEVVVPQGTLEDMRYVIVRSPHGHEIELLQRNAA